MKKITDWEEKIERDRKNRKSQKSRRRFFGRRRLRRKELVIIELDEEEPKTGAVPDCLAGLGMGETGAAGTGIRKSGMGETGMAAMGAAGFGAGSYGAGEKQGDGRKRTKSGRQKAALILMPAVLAVVLLLGIYIGLSEYYKNGFSYGTWINGIYCTGKTVEEVNQELLGDCAYDGITVYDRQGTSYLIAAEEIGYAFDFREALRDYLEEQDPYQWWRNLLTAREKRLMPVISFDGEKVSAALEKIPDYADPRTEKDRNVEIRKTENGYVLEDERKNVLDKQEAQRAVEMALSDFAPRIDLAESGCYNDLPYTEEMERKMEQWEQIREFQDCGIVYRFGEEEVPVDASVVCNWIATDENGSFLTDGQGRLLPEDSKIEEFVEKLADEYDTLGSVRSFLTTKGETVTVEGGTYGNKIDREAEKEYLKQAFRDRATEVREPVYLDKGWDEGKDEIGATCIVVALTGPRRDYSQDGRLEVETPIVTGNTGRRMGTPEGVNFVYGKARNRVLTGPGYASHVNFWMPVKGNIGIHDAAWRSEYGGEIYKTGGSHGCINTPYEAMSKLYDMAEVGTPVVMFYSDGQ